jgi:chromosome segregation ATPase
MRPRLSAAWKELLMDRLIPLLLVILGLGAAHLGIGGLLRSRKDSQEFWLFGLGVRTKLGAVKVLIVSVALCLLAYSIYRRGTVQRILEPAETSLTEQLALQARMEQANRLIQEYGKQIASLQREKETCQDIVSRQGSGLASKNDAAAELHASLNLRQREIAELQSMQMRLQDEVSALKVQREQLAQSADQAQEKLRQVESQMDVLHNENASSTAKLEKSKLSEPEFNRLTEENTKLKALSKDQDRRVGLLRQGLVLREANDWALEQEIQRLSNLLSDQPDVSTPRQTDIARSLQKINQTLREGQALTKQAKIADTKPADASQDSTVNTTGKKKN